MVMIDYTKPIPESRIEKLTKRTSKPHIYIVFYRGSDRFYWRVSTMPKPFKECSPKVRVAWDAAHQYVNKLNELITISRRFEIGLNYENNRL